MNFLALLLVTEATIWMQFVHRDSLNEDARFPVQLGSLLRLYLGDSREFSKSWSQVVLFTLAVGKLSGRYLPYL